MASQALIRTFLCRRRPPPKSALSRRFSSLSRRQRRRGRWPWASRRRASTFPSLSSPLSSCSRLSNIFSNSSSRLSLSSSTFSSCSFSRACRASSGSPCRRPWHGRGSRRKGASLFAAQEMSEWQCSPQTLGYWWVKSLETLKYDQLRSPGVKGFTAPFKAKKGEEKGGEWRIEQKDG